MQLFEKHYYTNLIPPTGLRYTMTYIFERIGQK